MGGPIVIGERHAHLALHRLMASRLAKLRKKAYYRYNEARLLWYRRVWGMDIGEGCRISSEAKLDRTHPRGIHIGDYSMVTFGVAILSHDFVGNRHLDTWIGSHCFIGARSVIMPGVRIGDHCVVGAGSLVNADVPPHSLVVGSPARVVRAGIVTGRWGIMDDRFLDAEARDGRPRVVPPAA